MPDETDVVAGIRAVLEKAALTVDNKQLTKELGLKRGLDTKGRPVTQHKGAVRTQYKDEFSGRTSKGPGKVVRMNGETHIVPDGSRMIRPVVRQRSGKVARIERKKQQMIERKSRQLDKKGTAAPNLADLLNIG